MASYTFDPRVEDAIQKAAAAYNVPVESMRAMAKIESGGNPAAKNPNSSAGGLFQQIDANARQYGVADKYDPYQSSMGAAKMMAESRDKLTPILGRAPNTGEYYLAHQQGLGGATKLLANPNAPASSVVGSAAANLNAGSGLTAGQFANQWMNKANNLVMPVGTQAAAQATQLAAGQTAASVLPTVASSTGIPALAADNSAVAAEAADPVSGIFSLLMQANAQPEVAPAVGAMQRPKQVDNRTADERLAAVSQTPNVYLERLRRRV